MTCGGGNYQDFIGASQMYLKPTLFFLNRLGFAASKEDGDQLWSSFTSYPVAKWWRCM